MSSAAQSFPIAPPWVWRKVISNNATRKRVGFFMRSPFVGYK